ncbi:MAG: phosphatase PAP2 family protein [Actinomycetota bacterium]|nr:phosphatase PAP2 family protein [Actinomycetota bacterium]
MSTDVSTELPVALPSTSPPATLFAPPLAAALGSNSQFLLQPDVRSAAGLSWRWIRRALAAAYGVVLGVFVLTEGVPTERLALFAWLLTGLSIACLGRGWRSIVRLLFDWLPFIGILVLYDLTRGLADTLGMPLHMADLASLESWMFGGTLPTMWLQEHLYPVDAWAKGGSGAWWHVLVTAVYVSHFLVTPIIAAVLWLRNRRRWISFTAHVVGIALLGVTTYILVPAAPPWYAAAAGVIPPIDRLSGLGWDVVGLHTAGSLLDQGQAKVNLVAALPSLHTAYAVLVLLFFWPVLNWVWRVLLALYPLLMGLTLVYSGEHYVVDVLLGWVCTGIVCAGVTLSSRGWRRCQQSRRFAVPTVRPALVGARYGD